MEQEGVAPTGSTRDNGFTDRPGPTTGLTGLEPHAQIQNFGGRGRSRTYGVFSQGVTDLQSVPIASMVTRP